jgi:hypothetical protein
MNWKKVAVWGLVAVLVIFLGLQLIPYGRQHDNPPVTSEVNWGDPAVRELAVAACYDCHSNELFQHDELLPGKPLSTPAY